MRAGPAAASNQATVASLLAISFPLFITGLAIVCFVLFLRLDRNLIIRVGFFPPPRGAQVL